MDDSVDQFEKKRFKNDFVHLNYVEDENQPIHNSFVNPFVQQSFIIDKMKLLIDNAYNIFISMNDENKSRLFNSLKDLRKSIIIDKTGKYHIHKIQFSQMFDVIGKCEDILLNILLKYNEYEILEEDIRLLSRLCRTYPEFLGPSNTELFKNCITHLITLKSNERYASNDTSTYLHYYTFKLLGHVVRQSKDWARKLSQFLLPTLNAIDSDMKSIKNDLPIAKFDPCLFALRGYSKYGATSEDFPTKKVLEKLLLYFYTHHKIQRIDTGKYMMYILKDIIKANLPETLHTFNIISTLTQPFLTTTLPYMIKTSFIPIVVPSIKIIKYLFKNGKQYETITDFFDLKLIGECLKHSIQLISCEAAKCAYTIIDASHDQYYNIFLPYFDFIIQEILNPHTSYKLSLHFTVLLKVMVEFYSGTELTIPNIDELTKKLLDNVDQDDKFLAYISISSLMILYQKLKLLKNAHDLNIFIQSFTESDGRSVMSSIIFDEFDDVKALAISFMNLLMNDGVPCAQLDNNL